VKPEVALEGASTAAWRFCHPSIPGTFGSLSFALGWGLPAEHVMGSFLVLVLHPSSGGLVDLVQASEQVLIQDIHS
jgi:hypothetical protein